MNINFKPLIDAIPKITSTYSLIALTLVLIALIISLLLKSKNPLFGILEKKFTRVQAYKYLKLVTILIFCFACFVFLLGYVIELGKIYNNKSAQTSVIIYNKNIFL